MVSPTPKGPITGVNLSKRKHASSYFLLSLSCQGCTFSFTYKDINALLNSDDELWYHLPSDGQDLATTITTYILLFSPV